MNISLLKSEISGCAESKPNIFLTEGARYLIKELLCPFLETEAAETDGLDFSAFTRADIYSVMNIPDDDFSAVSCFVSVTDALKQAKPCALKTVYL